MSFWRVCSDKAEMGRPFLPVWSCGQSLLPLCVPAEVLEVTGGLEDDFVLRNLETTQKGENTARLFIARLIIIHLLWTSPRFRLPEPSHGVWIL